MAGWRITPGLLVQLLGIGAILAAMALFYADLRYVTQVVRPETLIEYEKQKAIIDTKRDMRWCLGKAVLLDELDRRRILECAD
jgi:hypothetical protein